VLAAVLIAWIVLSELPGTPQLIGGILILGGIILVQRDTAAAVQATMQVTPEATVTTSEGGPTWSP
jgi:hypothetical protein